MPTEIRTTLVVGVADMRASDQAGAEITTYSLGSCLGLTVYDPVTRVGGLLHAMLPDSKLDPVKASKVPYMFVDTGVPRLFHALYGLGADRKRLVIKAAGCAQLLDPRGIFNIGERNYRSLVALLERNGLYLESIDIGGEASRTLKLDLMTGEVSIRASGNDCYSL